jgi:hypothetical protein
MLLTGRSCPTVHCSESAVEFGELEVFLRMNESYNAAVEEDRPAPVVKPVGVPGAASPLQMTPEHLRTKIFSTSPSPLRGKDKVPANKREGEFDVSTELSGFGLQGVKVTHDELAELVAELGLDGDDAGDLVKGLSGDTPATEKDVASTDVDKPINEEVESTEPTKDSGLDSEAETVPKE